jgi:hypothetical protein
MTEKCIRQNKILEEKTRRMEEQLKQGGCNDKMRGNY